MATAVSWLTGTVVMCLGFGLLGGSAFGSQQRSRFYARLSGTSIGMLAMAVGLAFAIRLNALPNQALGVGWLVLSLAALACPAVFCYRFAAPSGGDDGGSHGSNPRLPPSAPLDGAPLPDADQAPARRRDHNRVSLLGVNARRPADTPTRPETPTHPYLP